jgi:hypothetical protein
MTDTERAAPAATSPADARARAASPLRWLGRAVLGLVGLLELMSLLVLQSLAQLNHQWFLMSALLLLPISIYKSG